MPAAGIRYVIVAIAPAEAPVVLRHMDSGVLPPEDDERVQRYRAAMNAGAWRNTSVLEFWGGMLRDGRHRMVALSGALAPQSFHVAADEYPDFLVASERRN